MSSAHSYEAKLHDLEKELDSQPKPRKERSQENAAKKDNFVRTVGFKPSDQATPSQTAPPPMDPTPSNESLPAFISNFKKDAALAASLASSQVIITDQPPAPPGTTPDVSSPSTSLEKPASALGNRPREDKPKAAPHGKPEHVPAPKQKKQAEMTRAERRELQEKQRAEKEKLKAAAAASGKHPAKGSAKPAPPKTAPTLEKKPPAPQAAPTPQQSVSKSMSGEGGALNSSAGAAAAPKLKKKVRESLASVPPDKQVPMFAHLTQYVRRSSQQMDIGFTNQEFHPSIVRLGLKYADGSIRGGNARAVALLTAFQDVIRDFVPPPDKTLAQTLEPALKRSIQFIVDCRNLSVSMASAINFVKTEVAELSRDQQNVVPDAEAKRILKHKIEHFIQERIIASDTAITNAAVDKIADNDVVLTYACSYVVEQVLLEASRKKKRFRVIVVDARPHYEGKQMLQRLVKEGVDCTYVLLPALSYVMKGAKKVIVGASAMMNNGGLLSRIGTAMIAVLAKAYNVPFLVCCEAYKFSERVQLDSICYNELGNPEELRVVPGLPEEKWALKNWKSVDNLRLLHLKYDVTPPDLITSVITDLGMVPSTSVPVVLREDHSEGRTTKH